MVLDCLRITTGGVMVRACVVFGIGAVAGALLVDCLMPEVFGDYPLAHAIAMLATAEQQLAYLLSRNQGMKYRVLIADDHAIMREGVRALLLSDGSIEAVAAVDNGRDAVRLAVALKPDLAVMELTLPQMDGLSAIRELVHRAVPTPSATQVLKLIAAGRRNREIAGCLSLSVKTVEKHRANVMKKLDLHNTAALTAFAINDAMLSAT